LLNLVFIHGTGDDHRTWQRQRAFFAGSHAVLDVDLAGRGRRVEEPPLDSHEDNARDVLRRMDAVGMPHAILIGHSAGGAVAMMIALQSPDRVLALVLVATGDRLEASAGVTAPPRAVRADLLANQHFDALNRGPAIMVPTLVIGCRDDHLVPLPLAESLAASIPGAWLVILPECGHYPHVEQAAVFNFTLVKFLGRLTAHEAGVGVPPRSP
jgi:pimeloyl-ACP methyl ester carboxylesterase